MGSPNQRLVGILAPLETHRRNVERNRFAEKCAERFFISGGVG